MKASRTTRSCASSGFAEAKRIVSEEGARERIATRTGGVKALRPPLTGFRLRCGNYRVFFDHTGTNAIEITKVKDRKEAYR